MNSLFIFAFTFPFIVLLVIALKYLRSSSLSEYFLVEKKVDQEGFYKNSIGYSLQVEAIFLFFYWGYTYGLKAFIVPLAWSLSLLCMGWLIKSGRYDSFFDDTKRKSPTLHGYLKERLIDGNSRKGTLTVLLVTLATVIAIGSFLVVEVDYASKYLFSAVNFVPSNIQEYGINMGLILFVTILVALGGFKVAVETDRYLTPLAYVGFSAFFTFVLVSTLNVSVSTALIASLLLSICGILLLRTRFKIYQKSSVSLVAYGLTCLLSLIILIVSITQLHSFDFATVKNIFWPTNEFFLGFGIIGAVSLIIGNFTYLLSEVVMLQRNQSFFDGIDMHNKIKVLQATGIEMGVGWFIILVIGALLRGVTGGGDVIAYMASTPYSAVVLTIFLFSASVFMLSTVNGLVSSLGYISYFDIFKLWGKNESKDQEKELRSARIISFVIVLIIYGLYILTKEAVGKDNLALIITSLYGFQVILTGPAVLILFTKKRTHKTALAISTLTGFFLSWYVVFGTAPTFIPADSWAVISQGGVITGTFVTFFIVNQLMSFFSKPQQVVAQ